MSATQGEGELRERFEANFLDGDDVQEGQLISAKEAFEFMAVELTKARPEIFIPIRGYEGHYEVSNFGNVKSLKSNIILKPSLRMGYPVVTLSNGKSKMYTIHRLVALNFLSNPENKETVNHIDGVKTNDNLENLEWATRQENEIHSFKALGKVTWNKGRYGVTSNISRAEGDKILGKKFVNHKFEKPDALTTQLKKGE